MLSVNQIVEEMKSRKLYFTSAYSLNMNNINFKEIEWGINFTYRDKIFLLIKQFKEDNGYILQGNFVIGKVDLTYSEINLFNKIMKECDNSLDNPNSAPIKIINPNISLFKNPDFDNIFIKLRKNKINMVKIINAK